MIFLRCLLLAALLCIPVAADAATITAVSCNNTAGSPHITNAVTAATSGDTVAIPSGSCTWTQQVTFLGKYLTLQGAGIGSTIITDGMSTDSSSLLQLVLNGSGLTRLTAFTLLGGVGLADGSSGIISTTGLATQFRVDHLAITTTTNPAIRLNGCVDGVIDHNTIVMGSGKYALYVKNGFGCLGGADDWGDEGWEEATSLGTAHNIFFEANDVTAPVSDANTWIMDCFAGGRVVARFNNYHESNGITGHGISSGKRYRGCRHAEVYRETFARSGTNTVVAVHDSTSGTGVSFDNVATYSGSGATTGIGDLHNYRAPSETPRIGFQPWNTSGNISISGITRSGTTATATVPTGHQILVDGHTERARITGATGGDASLYNGTFAVTVTDSTHFTYTMTGTPGGSATGTLILTSPWDGNSDSTGYPALDQPGRGRGDALNNTFDPAPVPAHLTPGLNQALEPWYIWNNTLSGVVTGITSLNTDQIVANRDFYNYTASFDGTVGIGRGTRALRSATCTTGVAYWSTDATPNWNTIGTDGALDYCDSTNHWTNDWYTPYTYPHPLSVSSDTTPPGVPQNLTAD